MKDIIKPPLYLNVDATSFTVGSKDNGRISVKYKERKKDKPLKVLPQEGDGGMKYSIKYYALISAGGYACDPIYVIANKSMNEDDCDIHEVQNLGISTGVESKGYVVFCKSRLGNARFFDWFILNNIKIT